MTNKQMAQWLEEIFASANIKVTKVMILGAYVHIHTFEKYHDSIVDAMSLVKFPLSQANGGMHLDGTTNYRMIFKA